MVVQGCYNPSDQNLRPRRWSGQHQKKNVDVLLDQTVDLFDKCGDDVYKTSARETIIADCHFMCVARPIGSSWLNGTTLDVSPDENGRLMVDEST